MILNGFGLTMFAVNLFRLPSWSRRREQQLKDVADHSIKFLEDATQSGNGSSQ